MTAPPFDTLDEWFAYQQRSHGSLIDLTLERVREVAARLQLLHPGVPVATVGGTNGKGSTATALATLLQAAGRRVGLFTSPHLVRYNERIRIDGVPVDDAALMCAFEQIEAARGALTLTFFEYNTLAALWLFREAGVQALVLEVGLGGRLDATNIVDADVAVVCSIGLDHRDYLGDTLELIGAEKAGIFRRGRPVVLGSEAMPESVLAAARTQGCPVFMLGRDFHARVHGAGYAFESWDYESASCDLANLPAPALPGIIQYGNAATALTALAHLGVNLCDSVRVASALTALTLPGRFQIVPGEVEWILDVAHNEPAAEVLAQALRARACQGRTLAVAAMLADKDAAAIARVLDPAIDEWLLVDIEHEPRALAASVLRERLGPLRGSVTLAGAVEAGCALARARARAGDRVVVLGSFHVVGPALHWLELY